MDAQGIERSSTMDDRQCQHSVMMKLARVARRPLGLCEPGEQAHLVATEKR